MDREVARQELRAYMEKFKTKPFAELKSLIRQPQRAEFINAHGSTYQIVVRGRWESTPEGEIRVVGAIDDKHLMSAMFPVTQDFIVTPDGRVIE